MVHANSINSAPSGKKKVSTPTLGVFGKYLPALAPLFMDVVLAGLLLEHWVWYDIIYFFAVTDTVRIHHNFDRVCFIILLGVPNDYFQSSYLGTLYMSRNNPS